MQYILLIYSSQKMWDGKTPEQINQVMGEYNAFTESIVKSGNFKAGEELQPTTAATTVRVRNGKISTTDGPFVETKEQLGGFYLIEAKDLNEAIQIAAKIPSARYGGVEVRPVVDFSQEAAASAAGQQTAKA